MLAKPRASRDVLKIWPLSILLHFGAAPPNTLFLAASGSQLTGSNPVERNHLFLVTSVQLPGFPLDHVSILEPIPVSRDRIALIGNLIGLYTIQEELILVRQKWSFPPPGIYAHQHIGWFFFSCLLSSLHFLSWTYLLLSGLFEYFPKENFSFQLLPFYPPSKPLTQFSF